MSKSERRFDVYLTGFMGAGKSTTGRLLANRLGWEFVDLDEMIEQRTGKSIANIFAEQGESSFRQVEAAALRELLTGTANSETNRVIALGGGTLTSQQNRQLISESNGKLVFLDASVDVLLKRCLQEAGRRARPLAADKDRFKKLHAERQNSYRQAHFRVDTENRSNDNVVLEIENRLELPHVKERHGA